MERGGFECLLPFPPKAVPIGVEEPEHRIEGGDILVADGRAARAVARVVHEDDPILCATAIPTVEPLPVGVADGFVDDVCDVASLDLVEDDGATVAVLGVSRLVAGLVTIARQGTEFPGDVILGERFFIEDLGNFRRGDVLKGQGHVLAFGNAAQGVFKALKIEPVPGTVPVLVMAAV